MIIAETIESLRTNVAQQRAAGDLRVGLVPTMGALHAAHLSLIEAARRDCEVVVLSIFVNPTQFGPAEDFDRYPRPLQEDLAKCREAGVDIVFAPSVAEMYGAASRTTVHVDGLTEQLCGKQRSGHFDGVALVVTKLFDIVLADRAYFGQKDAQQAAVIKQVVRDLNIAVEIVVCPTVREPDGLAMSSRNAYLSAAERTQACCLYSALQHVRQALLQGDNDFPKVLGQARRIIEASGPCQIDYIALVDPETMQPAPDLAGPVLAAVAVRIGKCRLIDNLPIDPRA